jgi:hypothetical protein
MHNFYYFNSDLSLIEGYITLIIFCLVLRSCEMFVVVYVFMSFIYGSVNFAIGNGC